MINAINEITKEELQKLSRKPLLINKAIYDNTDDLLEEISNLMEIDRFSLISLISALNAGFHIILYGPPGTGKTTLSEIIPKLLYRAYPDINTADSDWNVRRVIGGRNIEYIEDKSKDEFKEVIIPVNGVITEGIFSAYQNMYLTKEFISTFIVIDEFNRTDMDASLGPLFTAMGSENKTLKLSYQKGFNDELAEIVIPNTFRMICSMNKYDRTFTTELSEALTRRFKWIFIGPPEDKDKENELVMNMLEDKINHSRDIKLPDELVDVPKYRKIKYLDEKVLEILNQTINKIREYLPLGTSFILDAYKIAYHYYLIRKGLFKTEIAEIGIEQTELDNLENDLLRSSIEYDEIIAKITEEYKRNRISDTFTKIFNEVIDASLCMTVVPACEALIEEPEKLVAVKELLKDYHHSINELNRIETI